MGCPEAGSVDSHIGPPQKQNRVEQPTGSFHPVATVSSLLWFPEAEEFLSAFQADRSDLPVAEWNDSSHFSPRSATEVRCGLQFELTGGCGPGDQQGAARTNQA